jgi:hypothetical protein
MSGNGDIMNKILFFGYIFNGKARMSGRSNIWKNCSVYIFKCFSEEQAVNNDSIKELLFWLLVMV